MTADEYENGCALMHQLADDLTCLNNTVAELRPYSVLADRYHTPRTLIDQYRDYGETLYTRAMDARREELDRTTGHGDGI